MEAAGERERRAHNARVLQAWNTAAIPGSKKKLNDLLIPAPRRNRQSPEQRLAAAQSWAAVMSKR